MANPQHVKNLEQGADRWNTWRHKNPKIKIDLSRAILPEIDLSEYDLSLADLSNSNFFRVNFSSAVLYRADLSWADFSSTNLENAFLSYVKFYRTDLKDANFHSANLRRTTFSFTDLSKVKNLEYCHIEGPCSLDYETLTVSMPLPHSFLLDVGLPSKYIEYIQTLPKPLYQYFSCFISYNEKNSDFCEKLYNDLKDAGVDCWRWRENIKVGDSLMREIDKAVENYDKVIIILSKQSLKSPYVQREISRALKKEVRLRKKDHDEVVLLPIRIDEYINSHHCDYEYTSELTDKKIGNFVKWDDPDNYQKKFQRLLKDLEKK